MANSQKYCAEEDINLGDMKLPRWASLPELIQKEANYMNAYIGQVYELPLSLDPSRADHLADILLLQKINADLVVGNIIINSAAAHETDHLHAYGKTLRDEAKQELARIAAGRTVIEAGVPREETDTQPNGPIITNKDAGSFVDSYYNSKGTAMQSWTNWGINVGE